MRFFTQLLKGLLPVLVLGVAVGAAYVMYINRPPVETRPPVIEPPSVRVQTVAFDRIDLTVNSQGTVQPRTSSQLVPEISGPIIEVSPSFAVGGFFEAGDVLLRSDPYDYQQAVINARSQLAQSELRLAQEEAEAEVARREWDEIGSGAPSALTLREPQVEDARAAVASAEAALRRAIRDLERADVSAPYAGRVQSKEVDVGQFVNRGNALGRIYAVDSAEIRLPLPDEELAYVNVPMSYRGSQQRTGPAVTLTADFAGRSHQWRGYIARTESEIDAVSRMVHVVAEVDDPYAPGAAPSSPPLAAGMFVEAEIEGRTVDDIVVLPWAALRGRDRVLVVDAEDRLRFRQVEVLRSTSEHVLVSGGLAEGERVCVSALDTVTDGMVVRVLAEDTQMAGEMPSGAVDILSEVRRAASAEEAEEPASVPSRPLVTEGAPQPRTAPLPGVGPESGVSRADQIASIRAELERLRARDEAASAPQEEVALQGGVPSREPSERPGSSAARDVRAQRGSGMRAGAVRRDSPPDRARELPRPSTATPETDRDEPRTVEIPAATAPTPVTAESAPLPVSPPGTRPATLRVAVLPFTNVSRNPADADLGTEFATSLARALEDPGSVSVLALPAAAESAARETAAAEEVERLVTGGYQRNGDLLRITARVLDVAGGNLVGAIKLDGTVSGQETLTEELVAALRVRLGLSQEASRPTVAGNSAGRSEELQPAVALTLFANISRKPADDQLKTVIAEAIVEGLEPVGTLSIVRLDESDLTEGAAMSAAVEGGAQWLVTGGYQHVAGQLRVTARLLETTTGAFADTIKVDGSVEELSGLMTDVVSFLRTAVDRATRQAAAAGE